MLSWKKAALNKVLSILFSKKNVCKFPCKFIETDIPHFRQKGSQKRMNENLITVNTVEPTRLGLPTRYLVGVGSLDL